MRQREEYEERIISLEQRNEELQVEVVRLKTNLVQQRHWYQAIQAKIVESERARAAAELRNATLQREMEQYFDTFGELNTTARRDGCGGRRRHNKQTASIRDRQVERQELQGNDTEDTLQTVHGLGQLNGLVGILSHLRVVLTTQDDGPTLMARRKKTYRSGSDLLQSILALNIAGVSHDDHDDWHVFVNECQGTVFQLPSQDALRVHLHLEGLDRPDRVLTGLPIHPVDGEFPPVTTAIYGSKTEVGGMSLGSSPLSGTQLVIDGRTLRAVLEQPVTEPGSVGDFCTTDRVPKKFHLSPPPPSFPPMSPLGLCSGVVRKGAGLSWNQLLHASQAMGTQDHILTLGHGRAPDPMTVTIETPVPGTSRDESGAHFRRVYT
ncbi:hypothetical protein INR49_024357, partial [Caranx melampygus]